MDTLRNYTFLPWLRQGLAAEITEVDNLGRDGATSVPERTQILVTFNVGGTLVSKQVQLFGPGDVIGINPRAIVKVEPRNGVADFEANYLPYIEFYEEEFPWRFTPAKADDALELSKLRPWIFLIVLSEEEFEERPGGPLPAFEIKEGVPLADVFPDKEQTYAWAHVHISQNIIGDQLQAATDQETRAVEQKLTDIQRVNPDNASSRLLSPRKLKENNAYHAFVIPAFETGRLAGLGLDIPVGFDGQRSSWAEDQRQHPIYYRWSFHTASKGDFEFLVDLLKPGPIDKRVGVRDMDTQRPGFEVDGMLPPFDAIGLEGALKSLEMEPFPPQWPPENTDFENPPDGSVGAFLNQLEPKVNGQFLLQHEETAENVHPDPLISPPLYGKWYAKSEKLDVRQGGWVNQLNSDPRNRTAAGVGTQVIQKDQERLMQQAWSQLGDLLQANQKIRQLQLGMMSCYLMYRKNIDTQSNEQLISLTAPVHSRVLGSPLTIARQVKESRLPHAALDPAFRRITRTNGAIMRKIAATAPTRNRAVLTQLNTGDLTAAPELLDPTGQISLDKVADSIAPTGIPEWLRLWLKEGLVRWALVGLIALAVVFLVATAAFVVFLPAIAVAGAFLFMAERLRNRILTAETFHESSFTPNRVDEIPERPKFVLTEFEQPMPAAAAVARTSDSVEAANFRIALKDVFNVHQSPPPTPPVREELDMTNTAKKLKESLNPSLAIPRRAEFILRIPTKIKDSYLLPHKTFVSVMAHPVFTQPMYRPLRDISSELLVPNLDLIPNNTISLMATNQRFIEAYMVGLNHEMGLELLWREFPTDQRGSYFRQFWDVADVVNRDQDKSAEQIEEELLDITKLHMWESDTELGKHENRPLPSGAEPEPEGARLVLVVRGDLLRKYPTVVIYAQQAKWGKDEQGRDIRVLDEGNPAETIKDPIFKAEIEPDIRFLGFDLTKAKAKGSTNVQANKPGWFFILQERPGEPRFGLDNLSKPVLEKPKEWNELTWEHLGDPATFSFIDVKAQIETDFAPDSTDEKFQWGRNAADMAYILFQVPAMVAFHAADMVP